MFCYYTGCLVQWFRSHVSRSNRMSVRVRACLLLLSPASPYTPSSPLHSIVILSLSDFILFSTYSSFHLSLPVHVNYLLSPFSLPLHTFLSLPLLLQLHPFPHVCMYILHVHHWLLFCCAPSQCSSPSWVRLFLCSVFISIPHWFHLPAGLQTGLHFYLCYLFIPHSISPLQHAPSCLLLFLYSSQQWVSDLNLSLCITGTLSAAEEHLGKPTAWLPPCLPCPHSRVCVRVCVCV